jgi:hypothetical protein
MSKSNLLLKSGAKIAGAISKLAADSIIPGSSFFSELGAESLGVFIESSLEEMADRMLSNSEKARIGAAGSFAISLVRERLMNGDKLRNDDFFFSNNENYRSNAEEIFEGVLLKCKAEHQERKIKYISSIFANVAFTNASISEANQVLKIAENLTHRQLCILSVIRTLMVNRDLIRVLRNTSENSPNSSYIYILQETMELFQMGLIFQIFPSDNEDSVTEERYDEALLSNDFTPLMSWDQIFPSGLVLSSIGMSCYSLMNLSDISTYELDETIKALS